MGCVLFDLDGTIADTEVLKAKALELAMKHFGAAVEASTYKSVMGRSWEDVTQRFFDHAKVRVTLDKFNPVFRLNYELLIDQELQENKPASCFIDSLKSRDIQVALVSSASPWMVKKVLAKMNLENRFDLIVTGEDVQRHKPFPDAYLMTLRKLNVQSKDAVAFEDSQSGFAAAVSAGLTVYGIRHAFNEDHDFSLCCAVYNSFDPWQTWSFLTQ